MSYLLSGTTHFLTIDVAEWYRDPAINAAVPNGFGDGQNARVDALVDRLLDELASTDSRATFFIVPSVARREPSLVRRIVGAGHEVGARGGYAGDDWEDYREDVLTAKQVVEDACGSQVRGYRGPATGPDRTTAWRFPILVEEGYEYDSSRVSGPPNAAGRDVVPDYPQTIICGAGSLIEIPLIAQPFSRIPLSVRRTPYVAMRQIFGKRSNDRLPGAVSFATWEIDDGQPRVRLPYMASLRHYSGRRSASERVSRLLREFRFDAIGHRLTDVAQAAPTAYAA